MGVCEGFEITGLEPRSGEDDNGLLLEYFNSEGKDKRKRTRDVPVVRHTTRPPSNMHTSLNVHAPPRTSHPNHHHHV
eukprot:1291419-Prymnesium_polylepis.1